MNCYQKILYAHSGVYIETTQQLKAQQRKDLDHKVPEIEQLDFRFVLFSSAIVDYDYIMSLYFTSIRNLMYQRKERWLKN